MMFPNSCTQDKSAIVFVALLAISCLFPALAHAYQRPSEKAAIEVTVAYEPIHNPPRALGRGTAIDWKKPGLTLELLQLVARQLGITIHYKRIPWRRALYLLGKNEVDAVFHASYKSSRENVGVYPKKNGEADAERAVFFQSYVLYTLVDSPLAFDGKRITHLEGSIGVINGYSIADHLINKGYSIVDSNSMASNFDKLQKGRIAAFAMLENMADSFLFRNSDKYSNVRKLEPPLKSGAYYLLFSHKFHKEHPDLADRIWNKIAELKRSDQFHKIIERY